MTGEPIDLRSDTVTKPSDAMRDAMARAPVGDDVYGEDPTVRRLEERVASILGKRAALFVPSGSMANQVSIGLHTHHGDEVIIAGGSHLAWYESGAAAALSGVQAVSIGDGGGTFTAAQLQEAVRAAAPWYPRTSLVSIENTHNHAGGIPWSMDLLDEVTTKAKELGLKLHMDGARLWNAAVASGVSEAQIAEPFDTVSVCFSKGLGAPVGSAIVGSEALIDEARRLRKRLGGGMRQAGIIAAGALYALENNRGRLARDHDVAKQVGEVLRAVDACEVSWPVRSNMVMVDTPTISAHQVAEHARRSGVLVSVFGPHRIRLVTHLDVEETAVRGARILARVIEELGGSVG